MRLEINGSLNGQAMPGDYAVNHAVFSSPYSPDWGEKYFVIGHNSAYSKTHFAT